MQLDDCYELGYVVRPHGTRGEVLIALDVDNPEEYLEMESVFIAHGNNLVPFFIENLQSGKKGLVVKFDGVDSPEDARELKAKKLYLPIDQLPELEGDQFYYHEIVNYTVIDESLGELGKVNKVFLKGSQDLIEMHYKNTDILIPIAEDIVKSIDRDKQQLFVNLPDGLLDVYLS